jgi:hypothetical protein
MPKKKFIARHVAPRQSIDLPPGGVSRGDLRVFTEDLFDEQNQRVGQHDGFCMLVRTGPGNQETYQCFATFRLAEGDITGRVLLTLPLPATPPQFRGAITGGTQTHRNVRGEITGRAISDTEWEYILDYIG